MTYSLAKKTEEKEEKEKEKKKKKKRRERERERGGWVGEWGGGGGEKKKWTLENAMGSDLNTVELGQRRLQFLIVFLAVQ